VGHAVVNMVRDVYLQDIVIFSSCISILGHAVVRMVKNLQVL
jgi:hypothetical protein